MAIERNICPEIQSEHSPRSVEAAIADLAAAQHGVVARRQLVALGLGRRAIDHRLALRRLHPVHRGVFAVGHRVLSRHGVWMSAVLAAGPDAVLSHRSAAALWGIRDTARANVDVIAPRRLGTRPRIDAHRIALPADEVTVERGIPVTTPARTLLDLAQVLTPHQLERAITEAEIRRLTSPHPLDALVARHAGGRGTATLKRILEGLHEIGETISRSELEDRFLGLLDAHDLPRPRTNRKIGAIEADAVWPRQRLIAELDGFATHATRAAFEKDRARDRALQVAGWRVVRITWRQLREDPATIAAQLEALLRDTVSRP